MAAKAKPAVEDVPVSRGFVGVGAGNAPQRSIRMDGSLWYASMAKASEIGLDLSTLIRILLQHYLDGKIQIIRPSIQVEVEEEAPAKPKRRTSSKTNAK